MKEVYLTKAGHEKLIKEYEHLTKVKRRELSKAVKEAREHGDISENAEYDAAKDAQGMNEKRVAELEEILSNAKIISDEHMSADTALIGATVRIKDLESGEEIEYTLVSEQESDFEAGRIAISSPVGRGLLGRKEKDVVEIQIPAGTLKYEILKISR